MKKSRTARSKDPETSYGWTPTNWLRGLVPMGDRTIDQIPPAELGPVVIDAANALFGSPRSELAKEVARKYGFARTGTKIASAIDASVQQLLDSGHLVEEFGKIRAANHPAAAN